MLRRGGGYLSAEPGALGLDLTRMTDPLIEQGDL